MYVYKQKKLLNKSTKVCRNMHVSKNLKNIGTGGHNIFQ